MSEHKAQQKHSDFQELAENIRAAEGEADALKANYDSKVGELLKKGREKSVEMRESYDKKAAEEKNRVLSLERQKTEKLVEEITSDAKKQASALRAKRLNAKGLASVFENFVSNL